MVNSHSRLSVYAAQQCSRRTIRRTRTAGAAEGSQWQARSARPLENHLQRNAPRRTRTAGAAEGSQWQARTARPLENRLKRNAPRRTRTAGAAEGSQWQARTARPLENRLKRNAHRRGARIHSTIGTPAFNSVPPRPCRAPPFFHYTPSAAPAVRGEGLSAAGTDD